MASAPLQPRISVEEYLKTDYQPDCDYTDGVVEERNLGEFDHSDIQTNLATFFRSRYRVTGINAWVEWRFQIKPTRFRVPDVIVMRQQPKERILTKPPLLCIEVLSPEDRLARMVNRVREYLEFGVPVVWVVNPLDRSIEIHRSTGVEHAADPIKVDGTDLEVPFSDIFD